MKPRLLDLFCGAGGCTKGYQRAGFEVWGVDNREQPRYCGDHFTQADVFDLKPWFLSGFDAVHASPPCQAYSVMRNCSESSRAKCYPDLIEQTREILQQSGLPWVIENVMGAPLIEPILVCGSMFDPPMDVQRHRLFEANWPLEPPMWPCRHKLWAPRYPGNRSDRRRDPTRMARVVVVAGNDSRGLGGVGKWRQVMDIDWMTRRELAQAIPPAYTELIGHQLLQHIRHEEAA